jgi:uncharacterized membrane protein HdeD (DUF308 family)
MEQGVNDMSDLLLGAIAMACFTTSLFFVRFWKTTRDRFFLFFALSFGIDGIGRIVIALSHYSDEQEPLFYLIRLFSFVLIIWAIADKNRVKDRNDFTGE